MFPPQRIVCLTEETVETLYLLGEQDRIVGISGYVVRPQQARREKPRVSAFTSANIDKILALKPDLVLTFSDLQADIAADLIRRGARPPRLQPAKRRRDRRLECTRPFGETKEPGARPMCPGDLLGNHGQRPIALAVVFEPVLAREDGMGVSTPLPHHNVPAGMMVILTKHI
jgi:hypothetical protein